MPSQDNLTLGQLMLQARMQAGVSIDAASAATRIPPRTIQAFENDDFDGMPPRGYAQNMLGAYARFLKVDANRAFRLYSLGFDAAANGYHRAGYDNYRRNQPIDVSQSSIVDDRHRYGASGDTAAAGGYAETRSPYRGDPPGRGSDDSRRFRGSAQPYEEDAGYENPYGGQDTEEDEEDESDYSRDRYTAVGAHPARTNRTRSSSNADSGRRGRADYTQSGVDYRRTHGEFDADDRHRKLVVIGLIAFIVVVLVVAIVLIVTAGGKDTSNGTIAVSNTANNAAAADNSNSNASNTDVSAAATANEASTATTQTGVTTTATTSSTPYTVEFTVAAGSSSWIQVTVDGATAYASTAVGSTTKSFTVTDTCEITIGAPSGVTVTRDGSPVTLTTNSAGIAVIDMTASGTS